MQEQGEIVNRVANSPLITIDLQEYYQEGERINFDIKSWLFQEMILKEKDFRQQVKEHDWSIYQDKYVALNCSVDAIVPTWAYMLLASKLQDYAKNVVFGSINDLEKIIFKESLNKINTEEFEGKKLVIKGCGDLPVSEFAYVEIVRILKPVASSIMYGEPCSTVPIYKAPRK